MKKVISIISLLVLILFPVTLFFAQEAVAEQNNEPEIVENLTFEDEYLTVENNQFGIDKRANLDSRYGPLYVTNYLEALEIVNEIIKDEGVTIDPVTKTAVFYADGIQPMGNGVNSISIVGAFVTLKLTKATSNAVLQGGIAGATTALGNLFGPVGGVVGAILGAVISSFTSGTFQHGTVWGIHMSTKQVLFLGYQ